MDVMALVGPSGTGKSHRALVVAHEYHADAIIDDGILIKNGKIIAGHSAKKEASRIMAVRRAIFILPGHADEVRKAIEEVAPKRILILGTSENMAHKIAKILRLPGIQHIVRIEDIATKEEMEKAQYYRLKEGKHIIPVPTIELKPHFSGYLIDPLQTFLKKTHTKRRRLGEKSIVRPIFSYYGRLAIDNSTVEAIAEKSAEEVEGVAAASRIKVKRVRDKDEDKGVVLKMTVTIRYGANLLVVARHVQAAVKEKIEYMTGFLVNDIHLEIAGLALKKAGV